MLALAAIAIGLGLGRLIGGYAQSLSRLRLRFEWGVVPLFVLQGVARGRIPGAQTLSIAEVVWVACSIALIVLLWSDRTKTGIWVAALGIALNLVVVLANSGMPISLGAVHVQAAAVAEQLSHSAGYYQLAHVGTIAPVLGDVLLFELGRSRFFLSVGDVLMVVGVATLIASSMVVRPTQEATT